MNELQQAVLASTAYCVALSTPVGKQLRLDHTWASVVIGTALTLFFYYRHKPDKDLTALKFFAATGVPIVTMCIAEDMARRERSRWAIIDRRNGRPTR